MKITHILPISLAISSIILTSNLATAGEIDGGAVLGAALGGAAGAAIGSQVGGRNGAILGGAIGGGTGAAVGSSTSRRDRYEYEDHHHHDNGRHEGEYRRHQHDD